MNKYLCWYAYSGMETEGALHTEEPWRCKAESKAEALWKFSCYLAMKRGHAPFFKNLSEYMEKAECKEGGWGFCVIQMHDSEQYTDDGEAFQIYYTTRDYYK